MEFSIPHIFWKDIDLFQGGLATQTKWRLKTWETLLQNHLHILLYYLLLLWNQNRWLLLQENCRQQVQLWHRKPCDTKASETWIMLAAMQREALWFARLWLRLCWWTAVLCKRPFATRSSRQWSFSLQASVGSKNGGVSHPVSAIMSDYVWLQAPFTKIGGLGWSAYANPYNEFRCKELMVNLLVKQ